MVKGVIVCDLDDTLIDTKKIKQDLFALAESCGAQDVVQIYTATFTDQVFTPHAFAHALFPDSSRAAAYIRQAQQLFKHDAAYNIPGVENFCAALSRVHTLILLTYGEQDFQLLKFQQSRLETYFTEIIVTPECSKKKKLIQLQARYNSLLVLDDSEDTIATTQELKIPYVHIKDGMSFNVIMKSVMAYGRD